MLKNDLIFIHIPKTGGSSVEQLFKNSRNTKIKKRHYNLTKMNVPDLENYTIFTIIREPFRYKQ